MRHSNQTKWNCLMERLPPSRLISVNLRWMRPVDLLHTRPTNERQSITAEKECLTCVTIYELVFYLGDGCQQDRIGRG